MSLATSPLTGDWVIDASVGLKLFIDDPLSNSVHDLFAHLGDDPPARFYVPDLFYIEVANVLWKYVRWQGLPPADAGDYLAALGKLTLQSTPTSELMGDALKLAVEYQITAYDASYLALAQRLDLRVLTADAKLARALGNLDLVMLLAVDQNRRIDSSFPADRSAYLPLSIPSSDAMA